MRFLIDTWKDYPSWRSWISFLVPAEDFLVIVDVLFGEQGAAVWTATHGISVEGAATFALRWQFPSPAEIHSLGFATAVTIERPLPIVAYTIATLELMPAFPASYCVYSTHDEIKD